MDRGCTYAGSSTTTTRPFAIWLPLALNIATGIRTGTTSTSRRVLDGPRPLTWVLRIAAASSLENRFGLPRPFAPLSRFDLQHRGHRLFGNVVSFG